MPLPSQFEMLAKQVEAGDTPRVSVRTLLSWFGGARRSYSLLAQVRDALSVHNLRTEPDFESCYIGADVLIVTATPTSPHSPLISTPRVASQTAIIAPVAQGATEVATNIARTPVTTATTDTTTEDTKASEQSALPHIDSTLISPPQTANTERGSTTKTDGHTDAKQDLAIDRAMRDPAYRIGKLLAANTLPPTVSPTTPLHEAITIMMTRSLSYLPVMTGSREAKGVISWRSIVRRQALGVICTTVADCMERAAEVEEDTSLFTVIGLLKDTGAILVRGRDKRIKGLVALEDVIETFEQLSKPFLLLSEIENHIREILHGRFTPDELDSSKDPSDKRRRVRCAADLTFGEYIRLLEDPERWKKLTINIDRAVFVKQLDVVRRIRNDVMHFDPDGLDPADMNTITLVASLLQEIADVLSTRTTQEARTQIEGKPQ